MTPADRYATANERTNMIAFETAFKAKQVEIHGITVRKAWWTELPSGGADFASLFGDIADAVEFDRTGQYSEQRLRDGIESSMRLLKNQQRRDPELEALGTCIVLMQCKLSEAWTIAWMHDMDATAQPIPQSQTIPQFNEVEDSLADVVLRIMDYAEANGLDLAGAIAAKLRYYDATFETDGKQY